MNAPIEDVHAAIQALLPEYLALAAEGGVSEELYPQVAEHLRTCSRCQAEASELMELSAMAHSGSFQDLEPRRVLAVQPRTASPLALVRSSLGELYLAFTRPLVEGWFQPSMAGAFRGQLIARETATTAEPHSATLAIELRSVDAATCSLTVHVQLPERDPLEQSGATVSLSAGKLRRTEQTDAVGCVEFDAIPFDNLPLLRLTVTPPE